MGGNEKLTIPVYKLILRINAKGLKIVFLDPKHLLRNPSGRRELHPLIEKCLKLFTFFIPPPTKGDVILRKIILSLNGTIFSPHCLNAEKCTVLVNIRVALYTRTERY